MREISIRMRGFAGCLAVAFAGLTVAGSAWAVGDDAPKEPACKRGEVYDKKAKKCVKQDSSSLSDEDRTDYAYDLAKAERYEEALALLETLRNPATPEALNYRGYATRKLGRTEEGIGYYLQSVALDPHYASVREYLGEAYVHQGKPDLAREQLAAIETICGRQCEEYTDLAEAIEAR